MCNRKSCPIGGCAGWGAAWQVGVPGGWVCPAGGCARRVGVQALHSIQDAQQVGVPSRWVCLPGGCAQWVGVQCVEPPGTWVCGVGSHLARGYAWCVGVQAHHLIQDAQQMGVPIRWVCPSGGCTHQMGVRRGSLALCLLATCGPGRFCRRHL